jgi:hypothetical protein
MRILAMVLGLVLRVAASGPAAGSGRATSMLLQLAAIPVAAPVNADPRVGPIFLAGDTLHICTGSVVHSSKGNLILTAAHCLAKGFPATFVPGFATQPRRPMSGQLMRSTSIAVGRFQRSTGGLRLCASQPPRRRIDRGPGRLRTFSGQSTSTGHPNRHHRLRARYRGHANRLPKQHGGHQWLPLVVTPLAVCADQELPGLTPETFRRCAGSYSTVRYSP